MIESREYEETRQRLMGDIIVIGMAVELYAAPLDLRGNLVHDDGSPRFEFMQRANDEYRRRGGTDGGHFGAVAEAVLRLVKMLDDRIPF